jgi:peptidoglycan/xylan/chitin deacetylase (PgdA/CDA1 family)
MSRNQSLNVPVLTYHHVEAVENRSISSRGLVVDAASFGRQMFLLSALGYKTIGLDDLVRALARGSKLPGRVAVITFDDGYSGAYESAFPILLRFGFTATLFLIAEDFVGDAPKNNERAFPIVSRKQVAEMIAAGFHIGSHSLSHPRLTELSDSKMRAEITTSKKILEDTFACESSAFCYPYGLQDNRAEEYVQEAGYSCACSTRFGQRHRAEDRFSLKRIPFGADQGITQFVYRLLLAGKE